MLMVRLLTVLVSFVLLFCFFYLSGAMLVGFGVGFETAMEQEKAGEGVINLKNIKADAKQKAAAEVESHIGTIAVVASCLSSVVALILGFSGIFPWCRSRAEVAEELASNG